MFLSAAGPFETRIARTQIIPWRAGPKCARAGVVSVYRNAARRLERSDYSERRMDGGGRGARSTSSSLPGRQTVFCRVHDKPGTPFRRKGSAEGFPFPVKGSAAPRSAPPAGRADVYALGRRGLQRDLLVRSRGAVPRAKGRAGRVGGTLLAGLGGARVRARGIPCAARACVRARVPRPPAVISG